MDTISIDNVLLVPLRVSEEDYIDFIKENPTGLGANFIQDQWYSMVQEDQIVEVFQQIGDKFNTMVPRAVYIDITVKSGTGEINEFCKHCYRSNLASGTCIISKIEDDDKNLDIILTGEDNFLYTNAKGKNLYIVNYYNTIDDIIVTKLVDSIKKICELNESECFKSINIINIE